MDTLYCDSYIFAALPQPDIYCDYDPVCPAQGDMSDDTNGHLIQARVTAQARHHRAHASKKSTAEPAIPMENPNIPRSHSSTDLASAPGAGKSANSSIYNSTRVGRNGREITSIPSRRKTRSRSKRQQQQQRQRQQSKRLCSSISPPGTVTAEPSPASTPPKTHSGRGMLRHDSIEDDVCSDSVSSEHRAGRPDPQKDEVKANDLHSRSFEDVTETTAMTTTAAGRERMGAAANCNVGGTAGVFDTKGIISSDALTVLSVTVNGNGWSEVVAAALATRARAGCVSAQEVDADSPQNSDAVRQVFWNEKSKAWKVRLGYTQSVEFQSFKFVFYKV